MAAAAKKREQKGDFDREKRVRLGEQVFVIKREYSGNKQIGEVLTGLIIRGAAAEK